MQRILITLSTIALLTLGCSRDNSRITPEEPSALRVNVSVETKSAVMGSIFPHEARINIIMRDADGGNVNYKDLAMIYTMKNPSGTVGQWVPLSETGLKVEALNEAMVLAHYPAVLPADCLLSVDKKTLTPNLKSTFAFGKQVDYNADNAFWFDFDNSGNTEEVLLVDGEVDYMTGKGTNVMGATTGSTIPMTHLLSMVVVKVVKGPGNVNPGKLHKISFKHPSLPTLFKGAFTVDGGNFTPNANSIEYSCTMEGFPLNVNYAMMVYPATIAAGKLKMTVAVDNAEYTLDIPATKNWEKGKILQYKVILHPTRVELANAIYVVDWPIEVIEHKFTLE